jgi:hypothetical protein
VQNNVVEAIKHVPHGTANHWRMALDLGFALLPIGLKSEAGLSGVCIVGTHRRSWRLKRLLRVRERMRTGEGGGTVRVRGGCGEAGREDIRAVLKWPALGC